MREQRNPELLPGWFLLLCLFLIWNGIAFGTQTLKSVSTPDGKRTVQVCDLPVEEPQ